MDCNTTDRTPKHKLNRSSLRRLLRARPYTNISHIRRYFGINGDDVSKVDGPQGYAFVALPDIAARMLACLWQEGKVGVELALNVRAILVDGVYSTEAPVRC